MLCAGDISNGNYIFFQLSIYFLDHLFFTLT
jgi:hypothetical protein